MGVVLILLLITHLVLALYFSVLLTKTGLLTTTQKRVNISLLLIVPFIWPVLIHYLLKRQPGSHEIAVKNDLSTNGYYESKTGFPQ